MQGDGKQRWVINNYILELKVVVGVESGRAEENIRPSIGRPRAYRTTPGLDAAGDFERFARRRRGSDPDSPVRGQNHTIDVIDPKPDIEG